MSKPWFVLTVALSFGSGLVGAGQAGELPEDPAEGPSELFESSLEELMKMTITTPSKRPVMLLDSPSAAYVITAEDIRRSGVTSIPDALRMAPGLTVSRIDVSRWAVSMRGFHGQYAKHLLVMIDGRSVYTPLFSGVTWELPDVMLEDIDRIEVVRGPGASTWGANAVNGVVNIITKSAKDTQGGLVSFGGGNVEEAFGSARYGGAINENTHYRVYVKAFERDGFVDSDGDDTQASWDQVRGGFRLDGEPTAWDTWSLSGDVFSSDPQIAARPASAPPGSDAIQLQDADNVGASLVGKWDHVITETSVLRLQSYYDYIDRDVLPSFKEQRDTFDLDLQHEFALTDHQQFVWGGGYRYYRENNESGQFVKFTPEEQDMSLYSLFVQDNIKLMDERLTLTVGSKFEEHEFTGWEVQPDARALYKLTDKQSVWASVSRAVRIPTRVEYEGSYLLDIEVENGKPVFLTIVGDDDQVSEELIAYETGYRAIPTEKLTLETALYYYDYDKLASAEPGPDFVGANGQTVRPYFADNKNEGEGYGGEVSANWIACDWAAFQTAYSLAQLDLRNTDGGKDTVALLNEGKTPEHQVSLRTMLQVAKNVEYDVWVRWVDDLSALDVPSYWTMDMRVGWMARRNLELAIVGQNLLDDHHPEFKAAFYNGIEPEVVRSVYAKATYFF